MMTLKFYPFLLFPFHPLWNRPGRPKRWSLGKDTTSGIHKDRTARQFKETTETNGTTTHLRRVSGVVGGVWWWWWWWWSMCQTSLSTAHIVTVSIRHVRNSKVHKVQGM